MVIIPLCGFLFGGNVKRFNVLSLVGTLLLGGCASKAQEYGAAGALGGATIGALTAKNKISGAAIGAVSGGLLMYLVGNEMDKLSERDKKNVVGTLEHGQSGQVQRWENPDGRPVQAIPSKPYVKDSRVYRDIEILTADGTKVKAKAYRNDATGDWILVQ